MQNQKTWTLKEATAIFKDGYAEIIADCKQRRDQIALNVLWNDWVDSESRGVRPNINPQRASRSWCCPIKVPKRK
jgi:hypothetical protein